LLGRERQIEKLRRRRMDLLDQGVETGLHNGRHALVDRVHLLRVDVDFEDETRGNMQHKAWRIEHPPLQSLDGRVIRRHVNRDRPHVRHPQIAIVNQVLPIG